MAKLLLLSWALTLGQTSTKGPGWQIAPYYAQGLEFVYQGQCTEENLIPGARHQRQYHVETIVFIHKASKNSAEAALQSCVTLAGNAKDRPAKILPGSVRLELVKLTSRGGLDGVSPATRLIPLEGPPVLETGFFLEAPLINVHENYTWEVSEEGRPARVWKVLGVESQHGTSCIKLLGRQQSEDWDHPRADKTAWHRVDVVWFAPQYGAVVRLERTIQRREPARTAPTQRNTVVYNLESKLVYPGKLFDDRHKEITFAARSFDEAERLLQNPVPNRPRIVALDHRIDYHLDREPPTPFRKSLLHLRNRLEASQSGQAPTTPIPEPTVDGPVALGKKVPDFVITDLVNNNSMRLYSMLGKPVLIFYYNPKSSTGREILRFAHGLCKEKGAAINLLALAVTDDLDLVRRQHADMGLPFSILDGKAMHRTLGVDGTPRLLVMDSEGLLRWASTGWGYQTAAEIRLELQRSLEK